MTGVEAVAATLPAGYRAREFRDSDREPWVEERNAQVHELQRTTADEWREWEKIDPPKFHLFYGFVAIIAVGILYSYRQQMRNRLYLLYGGGGLFIMGLGIRAMLVAAR